MCIVQCTAYITNADITMCGKQKYLFCKRTVSSDIDLWMLKMLSRFESTFVKPHFSLFVKYSTLSLASRQQQRHSNIFQTNELWTYSSQKNRTRVFRITESVSIDDIRVWLPFTQGIDSARIHGLAESIPALLISLQIRSQDILASRQIESQKIICHVTFL
jgi:hypothetical protein